MGFEDEAKCIEALRQRNGNVDGAVDWIFANPDWKAPEKKEEKKDESKKDEKKE